MESKESGSVRICIEADRRKEKAHKISFNYKNYLHVSKLSNCLAILSLMTIQRYQEFKTNMRSLN